MVEYRPFESKLSGKRNLDQMLENFKITNSFEDTYHQRCLSLLNSENSISALGDIQFTFGCDRFVLDRAVLASKSKYFFENLSLYDKKDVMEIIPVEMKNNASRFSNIVDIIYGKDLKSIINEANFIHLFVDMNKIEMEIDLKIFKDFIDETIKPKTELNDQMFDLYDILLNSDRKFDYLLPSVSLYFSDRLLKIYGRKEFLSLPVEGLIQILVIDKNENSVEKGVIGRICAEWICNDFRNRISHLKDLVNVAKCRYKMLPYYGGEWNPDMMKTTQAQEVEKYFNELFLYHGKVSFGILLITVNWKVSGQSGGSLCDNCGVVKQGSLKMVNCTYSSFFSIFPTDCPIDAEVLDLSDSKFSQTDPFLQTPPIKYTKLVKLYMRSVNKKKVNNTNHQPAFQLPSDFFASFLSLQEIDMSRTKLQLMWNNFTWPPKLRLLQVTGCKLKELPGLGVVQTLELLYASGNLLQSLPKIHKQSPIRHIELRENPLDVVDVAILAPLCELNYLSVKVSKDGTLNKPKGYCNCLRLRNWIKKVELDGEEKLICNGGGFTEDFCEDELIFDANILDAHTACLKDAPSATVLEILLYAVIFTILFPLFYFGYESVNSWYTRITSDARIPVKQQLEDVESITESHQHSLMEEHEEYLESIAETETNESHMSSHMNYE